MIPMVDLNAQFEEIRDEVMKEIEGVLQSSRYILGEKVRGLEERLALYHGVRAAIGVASGTDALNLSLKALGLKEGDEVITTPFSFFATVEAILYQGAHPVFADIDSRTLNIDPVSIEEKITPRTRAVLPVHLFGLPADMTRIREIADRHNLLIIEDCAQAFGATFGGRKVGSFGDTGCFSFYPSKNLGAYGDGGAIVTDNRDIEEEIRSLRNHGSSGGYIHEMIGMNSRLDEIQAAVLLVKLKRIDRYNELRRQKARFYTGELSEYVLCPVEPQESLHVYHQYTIRTPERDRIREVLGKEGISSVVYYPLPLHLQKALRYLGWNEGDFPVAEKVSREVLSLPIYPEIEESSIGMVCDTIKRLFAGN